MRISLLNVLLVVGLLASPPPALAQAAVPTSVRTAADEPAATARPEPPEAGADNQPTLLVSASDQHGTPREATAPAIIARTMLVLLALLGLVVYGKRRQDGAGDIGAGSGLQLAPARRGGGLDQRPVSSSPGRLTPTLAAMIGVTRERGIDATGATLGATVTATLDADVTNMAGQVVIPAGSMVELTMTEIPPAGNPSRPDMTLTLEVTGVRIQGQRYPG